MKKSEISQFYEKYLGPKCSRTTYYTKIRQGVEPLEALKPINRDVRYKPTIRTTKFKDEIERYNQQPEPKATKRRFYQRLYQGHAKEEAIKIEFGIHLIKTNRVIKACYQRPTKLPIAKQKPNRDYSTIKIRYSKEEGDVIKKEYERMIDEIEQQILYEEDISSIKELNLKIDQLRAEYELFISYQTRDD